ncbi:M16 family metallopeptidase [Pseudoalteromonas denitrificans]|uniref:Zinc protease n=1 Tax=Pseudoalteromonas denitrificans DSM 6059 TaxID=1123010 RepID=A0A1I1LIC9_9GAMM|nr:pitrilysin family protein [Pseudoalteromonas denitrificans]SFC72799.1 zinc protease [Pseudoalteromonas denitrificans DSM 6059]
MKRNILTVALFAAFVSIMACTTPEKTVTTPIATNLVNIEYDKFVLDNGLEVIFHIDRSDPVVAVALTSHVGSARELPGRTGFAHLFEHLLFLESENLGKGGLDKMSARIGGSGANGSTSRDRTNYFQTVPNDALEKMIWAEADKLGFFINTVTEEVLVKEKQVVKNEKRQTYDNRPYGHTQYVIDKNLYPKGHPYSWQVIGSLDDLQSATLQDVKDFYKKWYVPNNVTLVISGDFNKEQAKEWVHYYFDEIKPSEKIAPLQKTRISLQKTKKRYHEDNFAKLPELTLTWPTAPQYHKDSYALNILTHLLTKGKKAPLNKKLIDDLKLTSKVNMTHYQSELAGQMMLSVRAFEKTDLNDVNQALTKAFDDFEDDGFSHDDLLMIQAKLETDFYSNLSSVLGKGFQLAQYNIFTKDPGFINRDIQHMLNVNKADLWRVYDKYIKNKHYIATSFVPKGQKSLALKDSLQAKVIEEKIVKGAEQNFDASKKSQYTKSPSSFDRTQEPQYGHPSSLTAPNVWQNRLINGMHIFGIQNSEMPLIEFNIEMSGGALFDSPDKTGTANLLSKLLNKGTKNKTPKQLEEAIKKLGAEIKVYATQESIMVQAKTLSRNHQATVNLVTEMLLQPRWDKDEFALAKKEVISQIKQQATDPSQIADIKMAQLIYPDNHKLANNSLGTIKTINKISLNDLKTFYESNLSPNLSSFHIVGDIKKSAVLKSLAPLAKTWPKKYLNLPKLETVNPPEHSKVFFYDIPNAKQSQLRIGYPSIKGSDSQHYSANIMNYKLGGGGFASKLTQELREAKGYTYNIRSGFYGSPITGKFIISTGVRSNVTLEAITLIKDMVKNYQTDFNQQDLTTTKSFYLKSNARKFETFNAKLSILKHMSQYGLTQNYVLQQEEIVKDMTLESIKMLANDYLHPEKMIYLVVGDAKTQFERLKELGLGEPILLNP